MRKRILLAFLSILFLAAPATARTGTGLLLTWRGETPCEQGLREGLREQGFDIRYDTFDADQDADRLARFLDELDESRYDFIYTFGTTVSVAAAERVKTTPLVFGIVTTPVESGLIAAWDSSGNNVTGVSHALSYETQVEFIASLGTFGKIGLLYNPLEENGRIAEASLRRLLGERGIGFVGAPASEASDVEPAVGRLRDEKVDLVYLPSDSFVVSRSESIVAAVNRASIPSYGALEQLVDAGAMIGVVASYENVGRLLSAKVAEILGDKKPSDIPSEILPLHMQTIVVNGPVVETLGFSLPYEILRYARILQ